MKPAAERLRELLAKTDVSAPAAPVVHNHSVQSDGAPDRIRTELVAQLDHPVRWVETVQRLAASGVTRIVECGPGKVLTGLNKRIAGGAECIAITDSAAFDAALKQG